MTSRVFALAFAVLAGCAPTAGEWEVRDVRRNGLVAESIALDLQPGALAVGRIVDGGSPRCSERYSWEQHGRWFVNAVGETVVVIECDHEVPNCTGGTFNLCDLFGSVSPGRFVARGESLSSLSSPGVVLSRVSR